ncbi:MAG TPA: Xaa-Pro dipeptidase [Gammaproteobacteria bacterium]|nr:Xaa-Pro dipeptidase [Gammaproteobacteria bacterium]
MTDTLAALYSDHLAVVRRRFDMALERAGCEGAFVYAGAPITAFLDDNDYPFRVNPHFKYWVPVLDNPHCAVIYVPGRKPILLYHRPRDYWHKPAPEPSEFWTQEFDLRLIARPDEIPAHLPASADRLAFVGEWRGHDAPWGMTRLNPQPLLDYLHYHRAWKTPYELECLRRAALLGARAHRAAERAFRLGASEYEIHLEYLRACCHTERELPYGNIIALNEHGAVLHYQQQEREAPHEIRSFLIDAGAQFNGYACDITRTYSARHDEFQALVDALDAAQRALVAAVRPGLDYRAFQSLTHRKVAEILAAHDIVRLAPEEIVARGISRAFFPHGVGHYLGLQVHDAGGFLADDRGGTIPKPADQPYLRLTRTVETGQVFTVEPGIYFIDLLLEELRASPHARDVNWAKVEALRPYGGARIEDDVVVTPDGAENLTRDAFARLARAAA